MPSGSDPTSAARQRAKRALRPRDAATLVLVDTTAAEPRVLMGRRRADQVFLPSKFVFPGGRVDRADRTAPTSDDLAEPEIDKLLFDMKGTTSAARARALALAALRETFEETGIVVGRRAAIGTATSGGGEAWAPFLATGFVPSLAPLTLLARAITPPGRPRRYDTRFFFTTADAITFRGPPLDAELSDVAWVTLDEARRLDLPNITRAVVEDLADRLTAGTHPGVSAAVPYYFFANGSFCRRLIANRSA